MGIYKVLLLLNERGGTPLFLFQNLCFYMYMINNQQVKFDKNLRASSISDISEE